MEINANTKKLIDIDRQTKQTQADIATAVAAKQMDALKQTGANVVELIEQAVVATPNSVNRTMDIKA